MRIISNVRKEKKEKKFIVNVPDISLFQHGQVN